MDKKTFLLQLTSAVHPLLFSLYPVIALLASNAAQMDLADAMRPLVLSFIFSLVLFGILWLALKYQHKAALLTSLAVILFFTYGHVYFLVKPVPVLGAILGRQSVLITLWLVLLAAGGFFILRTRKKLDIASRFLNVMAAAALVIPLASYAVFLVRTSGHVSAVEKIAPIQYPLQRIPGKPLPDIYYIILDMYARDDVLTREFQLDTQPFLKGLEQMGFTVARCSQSNYTQTELSLASSLNMNYLDALDSRYQSGYMDRTGLPPLIKSSVVRRSLTNLGYKVVDFQTEYPFINVTDADIYLSMSSNSLGYLQNSLGANPFETMLLKTTAGLVLTSFASPDKSYINSLLDSPSKEHIARELFLLGTLPEVPRYPGPKFVYAHILIPHGPMVFGPDGPLDPKEFLPVDENNNMKTEDFIVAYRNQVEFIDNRILPILRTIIQCSKTPPIIILQGDHGPWVRPEILNAYYLPENGSQGIYPSITPVNSFRYVFDTYFGASYSLLKDQTYSTNDYDPFAHTLYPNTRQDCGN